LPVCFSPVYYYGTGVGALAENALLKQSRILVPTPSFPSSISGCFSVASGKESNGDTIQRNSGDNVLLIPLRLYAKVFAPPLQRYRQDIVYASQRYYKIHFIIQNTS
jgi:hypothetical protein